MLFFVLWSIASLLSTLLALVLAAFVLTRNRRAWANRWLALSLAAMGTHEATLLASSLPALADYRLVLFRVALASAGLFAPSLLAFGLTFGERNGYSRFTRWRPALVGLTAIVPLLWIGLATEHVVHPIRLGSTGFVLIGLDVWGKVYFCLYLIGLALVLLHLENLYRSAERITRWNIKFLVVGIFSALAYQIVAGSFALLYGFIHPLYPFLGALVSLVGECMIAFSLVRHHLLDVDIFVSRYVVYRSLTLALVGGYLLSLGLVAEVFQRLNMPLDLLSGTFLAILGGTALSLLLL